MKTKKKTIKSIRQKEWRDKTKKNSKDDYKLAVTFREQMLLLGIDFFQFI